MKPLAILTLVCLGLHPMANAQTPASVYLNFSFQVASATNNLNSAQLPALQMQISEQLAQACSKALPFYRMTASETPRRPGLRVWLSEGVEWLIKADVLGGGPTPLDTFQGRLFEPGEYTLLAGTLNSNRWVTLIEQRFEENLLALQGARLKACLQTNVPLGHGTNIITLTDPPPLAPDPRQFVVLPLDWSHYGWLANSKFLILCQSPAGPVSLHSAGIMQSAAYTPNHPQFDGIAVRMYAWEEMVLSSTSSITNRLGELPNLKPLSFYLQSYVPVPSDWITE